MPLAVFALSLSVFAIGTTEFVVVGLLPDLSDSLGVDIPTAGLLVTAYALGIALGGPVLAALTARIERKKLLLVLMVLFIIGNLVAGLTPNFTLLLVARVLTAFTHAVFVSAGIALALGLVDPKRQARAIAAVLGGLTIALAVGVPLGTFLGESFGWRVPFFVVAGLGTLALVADVILLPRTPAGAPIPLRAQLRMLARPRLIVALLTVVFGFGGQILAYTYVAPFLETITKVPASNLSALLFVFGIAAAVGTFVAGPVGDKWPVGSAAVGLSILAVVLLVMTFVAGSPAAAIVGLILWGALGFGLGPILQNLVNRAAPGIPTITGSLAISGFNLGVAGGSVIGGAVVAGLGVGSITWVGAAVVAVSAFLTIAVGISNQPTPLPVVGGVSITPAPNATAPGAA
jgi:DHA1 family inner membrane transport protein